MPRTTENYVDKVLSHLTGLTAQKDYELLTLSLLKSLTELLPNASVQTVSVDSNLKPIRQYKYSDENLHASESNIALDGCVSDAIEKLQGSGSDDYHQSFKDTSLSLYFLNEIRVVNHYLVVELPREFTPNDDSIIKGVLGIYRNFSSLLLHAQTDELTGLANRKTFESAINRIYQSQNLTHQDFYQEHRHNAQADAECYWICAIDIDHFKSVNDNYGHLFGDEVLLRLAQLMQTVFRLDDLLFRFGGEEFIVLLKAPDKDAARCVLERFRIAVENTEFAKVGSITVSIGVVEVDTKQFHMTLMDYADQALYYSKNNGRNRISFFDELVEEGLANFEQFEEGSIELF